MNEWVEAHNTRRRGREVGVSTSPPDVAAAAAAGGRRAAGVGAAGGGQWDAETDRKALEAGCRELQMDGLVWGQCE